MSQVQEIWQGWTNFLRKENLSHDEKRVAEQRLQSCGNCHHAQEQWIKVVVDYITELITGKRKKVKERRRNGFKCGVCNCPLIPHAVSWISECPLPEYRGFTYGDQKRWGRTRFENGVLVTGEEIYITGPSSGFAEQTQSPQ